MTTTFDQFPLSPALLRAIAEQTLLTPTPVQQEAIPAVLAGRDVWARAQTGSGKTAAYALPILERLDRTSRARNDVSTLVIVPTRELASQVGAAFREFARFLPMPRKVLTVFGGVSSNPQMMALRGGADVLVATPGRLLDLVEHNAVHLGAVDCLVLDEADRLFDLNFADELIRILALLPVRRQNLLFSATFPPAVDALATALLVNPVRIDIPATTSTQPRIAERAIHVDAPRRTQLLRHLIETHDWKRVLVFVATRYATEHVATKLRSAGIAAVALHGELSQGARTKALADFKAGSTRVIVATDLAARGIHVDELTAVVNYDLPRSADDYVHRIGRTGRAGQSGDAVSFIDAATETHFRLIEKRHKVRLAREQIAGFELTTEVTTDTPAPAGTGGIKGKRKSRKDKLREAQARGAEQPRPVLPKSDGAKSEPGKDSPRPNAAIWDRARRK
jgi:ATP-dependent RNA helicase RhlE